MPRRLLSLLIFLAVIPTAAAQSRGILGLPDRIMSSSRIGRVSTREIPALPVPDSSRIAFPLQGNTPVSKDFGFFNYLYDNDFRQDAITLVTSSYAPSDTLDFLRAKVLFSEMRLEQASELFASVPSGSAFGPESFYYRIVSLSTLGKHDEAASLLSSPRLPAVFSTGGPYSELTSLQAAGLALLRGSEDDWKSHSVNFTYSNFALEESERVLSEIASSRFESTKKRAGLAALASAVVPGAGKVYAGRLGEGVASFLTVGSLGAITAENWKKHGGGDWRTIAAGSLCAVFYLGNIYGSYLSVSVENDERANSENMLILYHLHLPLRSVFR